MYTPSFQPRSYVPRNMNLEKIKKKGNYMDTKDNKEEEEDEEDDDKKKKKNKKNKKKKEDLDEEGEDEQNEEDEENEDNDEESEEEKDENAFDFKQDTMKYADDDVQDALRNSLFKKKKKN